MRLVLAFLLIMVTSWCTHGQNYNIYTVVGTGTSGFSGDNAPATATQLNSPIGLAVDAAGNLYVADTGNHRIRKVSGGIITTIVGNGTAGFSGDNGAAINAQLWGPTRVAVDSAGTLYIADTGNNRVRKVSNGVITTVAGNGTAGFNGDFLPAISAELNSPWGIAVDLAGNLYIGDGANAVGNSRIRKVSNGVITTVAGNGTSGYSGDNGPATAAQLTNPAGLVADSAGNLNIADAFSRRVRRLSNGVITTIAGNGTSGLYDYVGPATSAPLDDPFGVTLDLLGNLYIADLTTIRKISNGVIVTIAGTGKQGFSGDNGAAVNAQFFDAFDVAASRDGSIYVADRGNNRIRILTPLGPSCAYTVMPATLQAAASGTTLTVGIQTTTSCSWTVSGLPSWTSVSGASSGSGSATISLVVAANTGAARSAAISIAGVSVTISQMAAVTTAPPVITALVNAANFLSGPIAPGEIVKATSENAHERL